MNETNMHNQTNINKSWNPTEGSFSYSFAFAFQTREQYLEFRRLWKQSYAALSKLLAAQKQLVRVTMRKREYAGESQRRLVALKLDASVELSMLKAAKLEANRQYLASKQLAK